MIEDKRHVVLLFGGRSTEHEVACRSANFILRHLDRDRYHVHAIGIDEQGTWWPQDVGHLLAQPGGRVGIVRTEQKSWPQQHSKLTPLSHILAAVSEHSQGPSFDITKAVIFPMLHGTFGEDGTMQGLLELSELAFVGPDTLGSAVGMDKVVAKKLAAYAGVPVVPWVDLRTQDWQRDSQYYCTKALELGLPLFVKPARLGSSVGVTKVKHPEEMIKACADAFAFDDRILIEKGLDVREIEVAALGGYDPEVSVAGEVIPHAEFYSYDAKYNDSKAASVKVPADLVATQVAEAQTLAKQVFVALDLYGMARIDLFLEKVSGKFFFNEVNTIPGFTEISQYPMLWAASGIQPAALLDKLIGSAVQRQDTKSRLKRRK